MNAQILTGLGVFVYAGVHPNLPETGLVAVYSTGGEKISSAEFGEQQRLGSLVLLAAAAFAVA